MTPDNRAICLNNEDRRRRELVAEDVEYVEGFGDLVLGICEQREWRVDRLLHPSIDRGERSHGQGDDLRSRVLEGLILVSQLNQLRSVGPSPASLEEDENDRPLLQLLTEGERSPIGSIQGEIGGDVGYLWSGSGRRRGGPDLLCAF